MSSVRPGNDVIIAADDALIESKGGDDLICAGGRFTEVYAGAGDDRYVGTAGEDLVDGQAGADLVDLGGGADLITDTDRGDDVYEGGPGVDLIRFGAPYNWLQPPVQRRPREGPLEWSWPRPADGLRARGRDREARRDQGVGRRRLPRWSPRWRQDRRRRGRTTSSSELDSSSPRSGSPIASTGRTGRSVVAPATTASSAARALTASRAGRGRTCSTAAGRAASAPATEVTAAAGATAAAASRPSETARSLSDPSGDRSPARPRRPWLLPAPDRRRVRGPRGAALRARPLPDGRVPRRSLQGRRRVPSRHRCSRPGARPRSRRPTRGSGALRPGTRRA